VIDAVFSFHGARDLKSRLLDPEKGGGGILDVGCYTVSMSRLVAGAALGRDVAEPVDVQGMARVGAESRTDEWAVASLRFENNILARVTCGVQVNQKNEVTVYGSEGSIEVPSPWLCNGRQAGRVRMTVSRNGQGAEVIEIDVPKSVYAIEAEVVADCVARGETCSCAMSWSDTLGNMRALDRWREAVGLKYPAESVAAYEKPLDNRPLAVRQPCPMRYGELPDVGKRVSTLVMGTMSQRNIAHATAIFDDFFARGGNCFDTAHIYAGGGTEKLLGQWLRNRGLREEVVVIGKGAHTPHCDPDSLQRQLLETLDRLQTAYVDIYFMHRDNPEIPVGEFVAVLNELCDEGQIRAFGGSNWSKERVDEANAWARANGKAGFVAVSNNLSLARMVHPPWEGSISSSDPAYYQWHCDTGMPLFAWSSQARGFFVPDRAAPDKTDDPELVRAWYSDDNFQRLARCNELAEKRGLHPVTVALAYVLHQPFPVFCLVGPETIDETRGSMAALDVELTAEEVRWLRDG
jgi:aryl-alcohol dehydrogenase-like predicted oxidoreductase